MDHLSINSLGHLTIGGRDTVELAEEYGTPLYVMSEEAIRESCRRYRRSIEEHYGGRGMAAYASKAFCCKAICRVAAEEGMGLDVVSAGELYTACQAGFPMERVIFHGNNKTAGELAMALEYGVGRIVADNLTELRMLEAMAAGSAAPGVMLRGKPGIDAHTHSFIRTGQIDSKFGFALETGEAMAAAEEAAAAKNLRLLGLHCHIGSQIFDIEPFCHAARVMLSLPPMLILDEATSSIDTRTESRIQRAFQKMMQGRTSFIVAHRLSTIRDADVILVMRDGHIVEQGSHQDLLQKGGFYAELYNSQFAKT